MGCLKYPLVEMASGCNAKCAAVNLNKRNCQHNNFRKGYVSPHTNATKKETVMYR